MDFQGIAIFMVVLLFSVSLHELMHAYVAFRLGDDLAHSQGRISLNPLNHIDPFLTLLLPLVLLLAGQSPILAAKPVPINTSRISGEEFGMAAVGLAGPFTNLILAFLGGVVYRLGEFTGVMEQVVGTFVLLNVSLFVFNMLPIPPLDGSRLFYAFAPPPVQRVMEQIESFGIIGLVIILMVAQPFISPLISTLNEFVLRIVV